MRYEGNIKDDYRLAMVELVHPDDKGLVRTVTVKFRKKNKRESKLVCRSKAMIREKVAVQRLHFLASTSDYSEDKADTEENSDKVVQVQDSDVTEGSAACAGEEASIADGMCLQDVRGPSVNRYYGSDTVGWSSLG